MAALESGAFTSGLFRQRLRELGYSGGDNIASSSVGRWQRRASPALAAELIKLKVDVIITTSTAAARSKGATSAIPIIIATEAIRYVSDLSPAFPGRAGTWRAWRHDWSYSQSGWGFSGDDSVHISGRRASGSKLTDKHATARDRAGRPSARISVQALSARSPENLTALSSRCSSRVRLL